MVSSPESGGAAAMIVNLLEFDQAAMVAFCEQLGEKRFRAVQLFRWIHQRGASSFAQMSDLARSLREKLSDCACVTALPVLSEHHSADGTVKWLFDVGDGNAVETVFIPEDDRGTLCISSQAGCAVGCRFCSTGHQGLPDYCRNHCPALVCRACVARAAGQQRPCHFQCSDDGHG